MKRKPDALICFGKDGTRSDVIWDQGDLKRLKLKERYPHLTFKPVYIVDASPDSKEVVVPRELLEWVENVRRYFKRGAPDEDSYDCEKQKLDKLNDIWPEETKK